MSANRTAAQANAAVPPQQPPRKRTPKLRSVFANTAFWRRAVQLAFLTLILSKGIGKLISPDDRWASVDALCPFGGVETLWKLGTAGNYLQKLHPSNVVLGLGLLAAILLAGGAFCGWICPFGTLQDGLTALRRRLHAREVRVPPAVARWLGYLRYAVLAVVLYYTVTVGKLVFESYDPYRTLFSLSWLSELSLSEWPAYAIALGVVVGSFLIDRFWCRFLCPLGPRTTSKGG